MKRGPITIDIELASMLELGYMINFCSSCKYNLQWARWMIHSDTVNNSRNLIHNSHDLLEQSAKVTENNLQKQLIS